MTKDEIERFDRAIQEAIELVPYHHLKVQLATVKYDLKTFLFEQDRTNENALVSTLPGSLHQFNGLPNDDPR